MKGGFLLLSPFIAVVAYILYKCLLSCFEDCQRAPPPRRTPRSGPSTGSGSFPRGHDDYRRPPPPYSKYPEDTTMDSTGATSQGRGDQGRLGFWSGAALGGLGTYLLTRQRNSEPQPRRYDWENERYSPRRDPDHQAPRPSGAFSRQQQSWSNNREGSSNLGPMRRSTGFGGSTVR
ncbi:hypothetical protein BJV74DRAFT_174422 [Russula compacta]|nr:hypothetical protein BJV74DRAFT_174422 [Russula compacta]